MLCQVAGPEHGIHQALYRGGAVAGDDAYPGRRQWCTYVRMRI